MSVCGAKYAHLVPEPVDLADPLVFGWDAYAIAKAAADKLHNLVRASADRVKLPSSEIEGLSAYYEAYDELPSSTWTAPLTPDETLIANAQANAELGACMLERLEKAGASVEVPAKGTQSTGKGLLGQAMSWAFLLAVLGGGYYFLKKGTST